MASKSKVYFYFHKVSFSLKHRSLVKKVIEGVFARHGIALSSLNYVFCTDPYLLEINRSFLKHDYYTDIVTFTLSDRGAPINGEAYISIDRVRDNARTNGSTIQMEIFRVMIHGALHLCGLNDKTVGQVSKMRKEEEHFLSKLKRQISRKTVSR